MSRQLLAGGALAAGALLTALLSGVVGTEVMGVALLGLAVGGALGLVPDATPARRAGAFALGLVAAWVGYLLRALLLPDATSGRAVAVAVVVALCAVVAVASVGRLPLWAALLGAGAMAGAYETAYAADPTALASTSPTQATAVLLSAGLGFLATSLVAPRTTSATDEDREPTALAPAPAVPRRHATPAPAPAATRPAMHPLDTFREV